MSIFLIRHGETLGNASRTVQLPDNPLSPRGMTQAERLARRLEREGIASILSSDLARAVTTADYLRGATGAPVRYDPLLQERNFGDLRGTPYAELRFDMFAPAYTPPNGESWEVFHARVDRAWALVQQAAAAAKGNLAVVTHGLVCRSLAGRHLILPDGQEAPELDGCLDVDLGATILTNTLAIRKLGMNVGGAGDLRAVWVSEDLETVEPAPQRYERIHDDRYDFVALDSGERYPLVVDSDGFVVTYPNLAERLR